MALPQAREARPFYQTAWQRLEDGQTLLKANRNTGAAYLAGYAIECMLKALILSSLPARERKNALESFRGQKAHDYEWLKNEYKRSQGKTVPRSVGRDFIVVNSWCTDWRYKPGSMPRRQAQNFMLAVERIVAWAEGRLS